MISKSQNITILARILDHLSFQTFYCKHTMKLNTPFL